MNAVPDIPAFLDRRSLIGTFTMLNCYASICEFQAYRRYVAKDIKFVPTVASEFGNKVHEAFQYRISGGKPLPPDMQQWESLAAPFDGRGARTELQMGLTAEGRATGFFDRDVKYRVKVDCVILADTFGYMIDWKTGSSRFEDAYELEIGAMHLKAKYPQLTRVIGQYAWLKENRLGQPHDLSNFSATWQKTSGLLARMERAREQNDWPKRQGPLCAHCDVRDCEFNKKRLTPEAEQAIANAGTSR